MDLQSNFRKFHDAIKFDKEEMNQLCLDAERANNTENKEEAIKILQGQFGSDFPF